MFSFYSPFWHVHGCARVCVCMCVCMRERDKGNMHMCVHMQIITNLLDWRWSGSFSQSSPGDGRSEMPGWCGQGGARSTQPKWLAGWLGASFPCGDILAHSCFLISPGFPLSIFSQSNDTEHSWCHHMRRKMKDGFRESRTRIPSPTISCLCVSGAVTWYLPLITQFPCLPLGELNYLP